jgi:hypothetical protein
LRRQSPVDARLARGQGLLVDLLFWVTLVIVADALIGNWLGIMGYIDGGWFWFGNQGLSYIQLGRPWQIGFFIGLVLWSLLVFRALWLTAAMLWQATRQFWTGRIRLERLIWAATINIAVRKVLHAHRFLALVGRASMGRAVVRILRCQLAIGFGVFLPALRRRRTRTVRRTPGTLGILAVQRGPGNVDCAQLLPDRLAAAQRSVRARSRLCSQHPVLRNHIGVAMAATAGRRSVRRGGAANGVGLPVETGADICAVRRADRATADRAYATGTGE